MPATKNKKPFTEPLAGIIRKSAEGQLRYALALKRDAERDVREGKNLEPKSAWTYGAVTALASISEEVGYIRALLQHDDSLRAEAGLPRRKWARSGKVLDGDDD